jgi:drug/metabolite transporter (DMT)-like permease
MNILRDQKKVGVLQVATGAVMISFSSVFVKIVNTGPAVIGFYRMVFGGVILLVSLIILKGRLWQGRRHFLLALSCSIIFSIDLILWHRSIFYIGPGLATLLSNFQVFFLAGFTIFILKEKITPKMIMAIFLAVIGLYLLVGIDWHLHHKIGIFLALATALCYAVYVLILRKIVSKAGTFSVSNLATLTLITLINMCIVGAVAFLYNESFYVPAKQSWLALLAYGLVSQVLAWIFISAGMPKITPLQVGLVLILQPALAFIWDITFFARPTPAIEVIGAIICIGGIYLGTVQTGRYSA